MCAPRVFIGTCTQVECIWGRKLGHGGNVPEARIDIQTRQHHPRLSLFSCLPLLLALFHPSFSILGTLVCLFFPSAVYPAVRRVNGPTGDVFDDANGLAASREPDFSFRCMQRKRPFTSVTTSRKHNEPTFDGTIRRNASKVTINSQCNRN